MAYEVLTQPGNEASKSEPLSINVLAKMTGLVEHSCGENTSLTNSIPRWVTPVFANCSPATYPGVTDNSTSLASNIAYHIFTNSRIGTSIRWTFA